MGNVVKVDDLKFVDEPPPRRVAQPTAIQRVMAALAEHKDRWAMIAVNEKATIGPTLRRAYPDFEIVCRNEKPKAAMTEPTWTVWACYRGAEYQLAQAEKSRQRALKTKATKAANAALPSVPAVSVEDATIER